MKFVISRCITLLDCRIYKEPTFLKKSKRNLKFSVIAFLLITSSAWASLGIVGYKFSLYGGLQKTVLDPSSFTMAGEETEQLVPSHNTSTDITWGLGAAYRMLPPNYKSVQQYTRDISIGLDMFYFQANQNGTALDYSSSPEFDYRLNVRSLRFMGNIEWTFLPSSSKQIFPFLEVGAGLAFNENYYADTPNPLSSNGVGVTFSSYTKTQFAYNLGAGLKWLPSKNIELSLRYLYSDLGSVYSGTKANLAVDTSYNIPLKTQSLILGLSYLL